MARFKHSNASLDLAALALEILGGKEGVIALERALPDDRKPGELKYGQETFGRIEAVLNHLGAAYGGDGLAAVQAINGGAKVTIEEIIATFFDKNGRCIPFRGIEAAICDPNREFHLIQPETIDFKARLERMNDAFEGKVELVDAGWLEDAIGNLKAKIEGDSKIANALKGVHLPNLVPHMLVTDHGQLLEFLLLAFERAYKAEFPGRRFTNYLRGQLEEKVTVVPESRLDIFLARAKEGAVATIEFPCATQGFSVHAQREQVETLPEGFILNGFNAICMAIMWPDVICWDYKTPVIDLSAYQWQGAEYSLYLYPSGAHCDFARRAPLGLASAHCSGGVSFLG